jgi:DNA-binding FadR family transcriptional regulator
MRYRVNEDMPVTADLTILDAPKTSRAQTLADHVEREISQNSLQKGDRLGTKEDLRLRFRVAAATVNEALRILEMKGLVEARPGPGGGIFVATPSFRVRLNQVVLAFQDEDTPISDCLAVRNALEPLVCREASRVCTAALARKLRSIIDQMASNVSDPAKFLKLNWELHRRLAQSVSNQPLKALYLTLLDFVEGALTEVSGVEHFDATDNLAVHRELVEAIIEGDAKRLARAIDAHTPIAERWRGEDR